MPPAGSVWIPRYFGISITSIFLLFGLCALWRSHEIDIVDRPRFLAAKARAHRHADAHGVVIDADQPRHEKRVHAIELDEAEQEWAFAEIRLAAEVADSPAMHAAFEGQLEPIRPAAAHHA